MKIKLLVLILSISSSIIYAEEGLPDAKIKVQLRIATNYISKGTDKFTNRAKQKQIRYGENTGAPVFVPSITYLPPTKGFFYQIIGYLALEGRDDIDTDGFIQNGPGGNNLLYGIGSIDQQKQALHNSSNLLNNAGNFVGLSNALSGPLAYPECKATTNCVPKLYKEENGVFRQEQIKQFIGYGRKTSVGKFLFSLLYVSPLSKQVGNDTFQGIIFEYSLPGLDQLILSTEHGLPSSSNYFQLKWVDKIALSKSNKDPVMLEYWFGPAYAIEDHMQGIKDVSGHIGVSYRGFKLGLGTAWRPDLRFHDKESAGSSGKDLPLWLVGASSRYDGLVADPSKQNGYQNQLINKSIQNYLQAGGIASYYTYTPRQKMPRHIYWVDLAYTFTIQ